MHPRIFENLEGNSSEITQSEQYGTVSCKRDKGIPELNLSDNRTQKVAISMKKRRISNVVNCCNFYCIWCCTITKCNGSAKAMLI